MVRSYKKILNFVFNFRHISTIFQHFSIVSLSVRTGLMFKKEWNASVTALKNYSQNWIISEILPSRKNLSLRHNNGKWPMKTIDSREVTNEITRSLYLWRSHKILQLGWIISKIGITRPFGLRSWLNFFSRLLLVKQAKSGALICQKAG